MGILNGVLNGDFKRRFKMGILMGILNGDDKCGF